MTASPAAAEPSPWAGARRFALLAAALVLIVFLVFVVNQVAAVVDLADRAHPVAGTVVLWVLVAVLAGLALAPLILYLRLPAPLRPPADDTGPEFEAHLAALRSRLARNRRVEGAPQTREEIRAALATLDAEADAASRAAASTIFMSTAVSQSGRLDTFVVLGANLRLVTQIARIYYQRPTARDLAYLYANVAGTAFLAGELDDLDVAEQLEPIMGGALGGLAGAVPGLGAAANLLTSSILSGTANAYLALRVGHLARRYCGSLVLEDRRRLRRSAAAAAAASLAGIVAAGTGRLVKAMGRATASRAGGALSRLFGFGGKGDLPATDMAPPGPE